MRWSSRHSYGDQISRLPVVYLSLLGSLDQLTAARPEHVALRTRYERRNTIEAGIKGVGSAGEIWSDPHVSILLIGTSPAHGGRSVAGYVCLSQAKQVITYKVTKKWYCRLGCHKPLVLLSTRVLMSWVVIADNLKPDDLWNTGTPNRQSHCPNADSLP